MIDSSDSQIFLQEMFYNTSNKSGWILYVLKTRRLALKRDKNIESNSNIDKKLEPDTAMYSAENAREDVEYMRTALVDPLTMPQIKEKLLLTRKYRTDLCKKPNIDFRTLFPYFFTHPELVSIHYLFG